MEIVMRELDPNEFELVSGATVAGAIAVAGLTAVGTVGLIGVAIAGSPILAGVGAIALGASGGYYFSQQMGWIS